MYIKCIFLFILHSIQLEWNIEMVLFLPNIEYVMLICK